MKRAQRTATVTVERPWSDGERTVLAAERPHGTVSRQLLLGRHLDLERLRADLDPGVLTVTIPVVEQSEQRKIAVGGDSGRSEPIETWPERCSRRGWW